MDQKKTEFARSDNPIAVVLGELCLELGIGSLNKLFEKAGVSSNTKTWYSRVNPDYNKATRTRKKDLDAFIMGLFLTSSIELDSDQITRLHIAAGITIFSSNPDSYKLIKAETNTALQSNKVLTADTSIVEPADQEAGLVESYIKPAYLETQISATVEPYPGNAINNGEGISNTFITQSGSNNLSLNIQNATVINNAKYLQSATIIQEPNQVTVIDRSIYEQSVKLAAQHYLAEKRKSFILTLVFGFLLLICIVAGIALFVGFFWDNINPSAPVKIEVIGQLKLTKVSLVTGEYLEATFTIANEGEEAIHIQDLEAGVRLNSEDWSGLNFDFPTSSNIKLEPKETFTYTKWRSFPQTGKYFAEPVIQLNGHWGGITNSNRVYFNVLPGPPSTLVSILV